MGDIFFAGSIMDKIKDSDIENINSVTKEAWGENWINIDIETILEIFNYPRVRKLMGIIVNYIPKEGPVLEAGCGLGPWVIKLDMLGYKIVGIDYQKECVDKIKAYNDSLEVYTADVRSIPFGENHFSAYLSWGVIEHFAEGPDDVLKEAHRVLKPKGKLILTVPHKNIFLKVKKPLDYIKNNVLIRKLFNKPPRVCYYQKYFMVNELEEVISKSGFLIEEIMPVDHIFSLVEFCSIFRDKDSYDGENKLAVFTGSLLEKVLGWSSAGSILVVANKC